VTVTSTALSVAEVRRKCDASRIPFETTAEADPPEGIVGQERAVDALRFGMGVRRPGYNLFAIGPSGVGKLTFLRESLEREAARQETPLDWCYVHAFERPDAPRAMALPHGRGTALRRDMEKALVDLQVEMRSAFESDRYRTQRELLVADYKGRERTVLTALQEQVRKHDFAVVQTDTGLALTALRDGAPIETDALAILPAEERSKLDAESERLWREFGSVFDRLRDLSRNHERALDTLDQETARGAAQRVIDPIRGRHSDLAEVGRFLGEVGKDIVDNADQFLDDDDASDTEILRRALQRDEPSGVPFRRYFVNVVVDNGARVGAPVVYEDDPSLANLFGRVDHEAQFGTLVPHFTLIKGGALHRANGGYLLLEAAKVLADPDAWNALKRALRAGRLMIGSPERSSMALATVSLEPEPIPLLDTKIVLMGDREQYAILCETETDFALGERGRAWRS
jgi:hypothetical protein